MFLLPCSSFLLTVFAFLPIRLAVWGTSLAVQWLRLHASTAGGMGSIPGQGTKFPTCMLRGAAKKKKKNLSIKKKRLAVCRLFGHFRLFQNAYLSYEKENCIWKTCPFISGNSMLCLRP